MRALLAHDLKLVLVAVVAHGMVLPYVAVAAVRQSEPVGVEQDEALVAVVVAPDF